MILRRMDVVGVTSVRGRNNGVSELMSQVAQHSQPVDLPLIIPWEQHKVSLQAYLHGS